MRSFLGAVAIAVSALSPSLAQADTITADWLNIDPKLNVGIVVNNFSGFSYSGTVQTGVNNWRVTATTSSLFAVNQEIDAFCIEIRQTLTDPTLFTIGSLDNAPDPDYPVGGVLGMGTGKADEIRELWGEFFDEITNATTAAAFQLAVWNIVYDSDVSVSNSSGTFYATSYDAAKNQADLWLAAVRNNDYDKASLIGLTNVNGQDMVTSIPGGTTTTSTVPTPVAAGMGLTCFGLAMLQRRQRA